MCQFTHKRQDAISFLLRFLCWRLCICVAASQCGVIAANLNRVMKGKVPNKMVSNSLSEILKRTLLNKMVSTSPSQMMKKNSV